jgi:hypothetical protein
VLILAGSRRSDDTSRKSDGDEGENVLHGCGWVIVMLLVGVVVIDCFE